MRSATQLQSRGNLSIGHGGALKIFPESGKERRKRERGFSFLHCYSANSNPTGQWSEPVMSPSIQASLTAPRNSSDTKK